MAQAIIKTATRSRQFIAQALICRAPYREYAVVGWLMVGGAAWLAQGVMTSLSPPAAALWGCYLLGLLVAICAIDARFGIIPDRLVMWLAAGGLVQLLALDWDVGAARIGASVLVFVAACLLRIGYRALRDQDGLGFGDVKLLAAATLWIGLEGMPALLLVAVVSAATSLFILRLGGERLSRSHAISFGPHLAVALWLVWVVGPVLAGLLA